jgi:hypothetical protein
MRAHLHEHRPVAFPVTDLDAYEHRMVRRARIGGLVSLWFGFVWWGSATTNGPTPWSAAAAVGVGSICGVALWIGLRGRPVPPLFFPDTPRSPRDAKTWVFIGVTLVAFLVLYLLTNAVLSLFSVDLTIAAFGAGVWVAAGLTAILDARRFGRLQRDRYEADLRELAELPSRPDVGP